MNLVACAQGKAGVLKPLSDAKQQWRCCPARPLMSHHQCAQVSFFDAPITSEAAYYLPQQRAVAPLQGIRRLAALELRDWLPPDWRRCLNPQTLNPLSTDCHMVSSSKHSVLLWPAALQLMLFRIAGMLWLASSARRL